MDRASGSTVLNVNGVQTEIGVDISLEDIDRNGVAWCEPVRALVGQSTETVRLLGTLIVVAAICRKAGRIRDELGALRMARRITGGSIRSIGESISEALGLLGSDAVPDGHLAVVSYASEPEKFMQYMNGKRISSSAYHPGLEYGGLLGIPGFDGRNERPDLDNVSFLILNEGRVACVVPMLIYPDHIGSWVRWVEGMPGMPIEVFCSVSVDRAVIFRSLGLYLRTLARCYGVRMFSIHEDPAYAQILSRSMGSHFGYGLEVWDRPVVDLTRDIESIYGDVRKSYKSSINWGRRCLQMRYLSGSQLDDSAVSDALCALRKSQEQVYSQYGDAFDRRLYDEAIAMCKIGAGEVSISHLPDGDVCGAVIVTDARGISYYALGGARIADGNRSPSHWNVFHAIERAKIRGNVEFHLGRLFGPPISSNGYTTRKMSKRERDISFFKHGFSGYAETRYVYQFMTDAF